VGSAEPYNHGKWLELLTLLGVLAEETAAAAALLAGDPRRQLVLKMTQHIQAEQHNLLASAGVEAQVVDPQALSRMPVVHDGL